MEKNTIIISDNDDYEKECIKFLNKLIDDVNKFYVEKEEFNKYIFTSQNYKVVYFNENEKINSPIAILDGQWGSGKPTLLIDCVNI